MKTSSASAAVAEAAHQATRHDKRECEGDLDGGNTCKFKGRDGVGRIRIHQRTSITIRGKKAIYMDAMR